jgi:bifunctional non-homologous end joining protein LigD
MPVKGVFDGELVAFNPEGLPDFPTVCRRILHGQRTIPVTYVIFDVLEQDGQETMRLPYCERRALLESLSLTGPVWATAPVYDDGGFLFEQVCALGLEGIVAKRLDEPYRPGERRWAKVKNRDYWRFPLEVAAAGRSRSRTAVHQ